MDIIENKEEIIIGTIIEIIIREIGDIINMNMFKRLPYFVFLKNEKYKINVDFRNMLYFEKTIMDKSINDEEKLINSLRYFYPIFFNQNRLFIQKVNVRC